MKIKHFLGKRLSKIGLFTIRTHQALIVVCCNKYGYIGLLHAKSKQRIHNMWFINKKGLLTKHVTSTLQGALPQLYKFRKFPWKPISGNSRPMFFQVILDCFKVFLCIFVMQYYISLSKWSFFSLKYIKSVLSAIFGSCTVFRVLKYFNMLYTIRNILCMKSS